MIVYVLLGLIGLPVFAQGQSGFGALVGPAGGYLVGFVVGAVVIGLLVRLKKKPGFLWLCMAMAIGELVVYAFGVAQLSFVAGMSLDKAIYLRRPAVRARRHPEDRRRRPDRPEDRGMRP